MWLLSALFLALWVVSVYFYFPVLVILAIFAGMLISAGLAMLPQEVEDQH